MNSENSSTNAGNQINKKTIMKNISVIRTPLFESVQVTVIAGTLALLPTTALSDSSRFHNPATVNVLVKSANGSIKTPYNKLTGQQRKRIDRVISMLLQPRGKRPPPSKRIRATRMYSSAESIRNGPQAAILDCEYDPKWAGALCWIGDDLLCGVVWGPAASGGVEVGCF